MTTTYLNCLRSPTINSTSLDSFLFQVTIWMTISRYMFSLEVDSLPRRHNIRFEQHRSKRSVRVKRNKLLITLALINRLINRNCDRQKRRSCLASTSRTTELRTVALYRWNSTTLAHFNENRDSRTMNTISFIIPQLESTLPIVKFTCTRSCDRSFHSAKWRVEKSTWRRNWRESLNIEMRSNRLFPVKNKYRLLYFAIVPTFDRYLLLSRIYRIFGIAIATWERCRFDHLHNLFIASKWIVFTNEITFLQTKTAFFVCSI